jgi:hypothetical protein
MLASLIGSIFDGGPKGQSFRVAAQERLREYQQLRSGRCCLTASHLDLPQGRGGIKQHTSHLCDGSSNHNFTLNAGIGKIRALVEGLRTSSEGFRYDGQTGMSDVDRRLYRVSRDAAKKRALAILCKSRFHSGQNGVFGDLSCESDSCPVSVMFFLVAWEQNWSVEECR